MYGEMIEGLYGTVMVWCVSAVLALIAGFVLAIGLENKNWFIKTATAWIVNLSRGVPTSIYVILGGLLVMKGASDISLPAIFPGTVEGFEPIAWAITFALAFGSSGHLAEIFVASYASLGRAKLEQMDSTGFSLCQKLLLIVRECACTAFPPVSTRMIHHLHNTAFASLFPIVELFGSIQTSASTSFKVFEITLVGCLMYIILSGCIWAVFRFSETALTPQKIKPGTRLAGLFR